MFGYYIFECKWNNNITVFNALILFVSVIWYTLHDLENQFMINSLSKSFICDNEKALLNLVLHHHWKYFIHIIIWISIFWKCNPGYFNIYIFCLYFELLALISNYLSGLSPWKLFLHFILHFTNLYCSVDKIDPFWIQFLSASTYEISDSQNKKEPV